MTSPRFGQKTLSPRTIDRVAAAAHHTLFERLKAAGSGRKVQPWSAEEALALGRAYVDAHGCVPPRSRCRPMYGLPDGKAIILLFGSLAIFHQ